MNKQARIAALEARIAVLETKLEKQAGLPDGVGRSDSMKINGFGKVEVGEEPGVGHYLNFATGDGDFYDLRKQDFIGLIKMLQSYVRKIK